MTIVLIRESLTAEEIGSLRAEFPQFNYKIHAPQATLSDEEWAEVEVLYTSYFSTEELEKAHRLRWIHVPQASLSTMCWRQIETNTNILITNSKSGDTHQVAEFALSTMLAFAKNLFDWRQGQHDPRALASSPFRGLLWDLRGKTLLQIGLGDVGSAVAAACTNLGLRIWGIHDPPSYHPHCDKVFPQRDLHSLLPAADVVCITLRRAHVSRPFLGAAQFRLMKNDAILIVMGSARLIDQEALTAAASTGKFRGIAIDSPLNWQERVQPDLWELPNVLITPQIAELPRPEERLGYSLFVHNFRRFIHNDFDGMKNLISLEMALVPES